MSKSSLESSWISRQRVPFVSILMQNEFSSLEDKYNKAKQLIRGMQDRERQVIMKVRHIQPFNIDYS